MAVIAGKPLSEPACSLLREIINYSTFAFQRCQTERNRNAQDVDLSILMLYLHIIEMSDGIEVLLSKSCVNPTTPLLRTCFEALLGIDYILEVDYERRALSWMLCIRTIGLACMKTTVHLLANLPGLFNRPQYQPIEAEYQRIINLP
jgi:hypothetical protein